MACLGTLFDEDDEVADDFGLVKLFEAAPANYFSDDEEEMACLGTLFWWMLKTVDVPRVLKLQLAATVFMTRMQWLAPYYLLIECFPTCWRFQPFTGSTKADMQLVICW